MIFMGKGRTQPEGSVGQDLASATLKCEPGLGVFGAKGGVRPECPEGISRAPSRLVSAELTSNPFL